jgi:homoaconitase/3-isopropylmalate dehydratase large subunit
MRKNIVQKIVDSHLVSGELTPGTEVGIAVDHTLIQDATGTMAMLQFEVNSNQPVSPWHEARSNPAYPSHWPNPDRRANTNAHHPNPFRLVLIFER